MKRLTAVAIVMILIAMAGSGCAHRAKEIPGKRITKTILCTGYCPCKKCCGWKRNWYGKPVIASGANKGKPKKVGQTAKGTQAKHGTIAADTNYYPFNTIMYIPGYGYGRVEDRGGAIKGNHIDLFFKTHKEAIKWGRKTLNVTIWLPQSTPRRR
ncbi:MAG TPA: 3D domain-containing protein [Candidatus Hydrogenedentes bacterium]|nr:3D domain-containing protein [Candidatus Hydrogenedentota bacterium]